jgi:hypothetical protein
MRRRTFFDTGWLSSHLFLAALGCAAPNVAQNERVAIRPRHGATDSALVVIHPATLCGITIRDESGAIVDRDTTYGEDTPTDMTRRVPDAPWEVREGENVAILFTAVAMPAGHYTLVEQAWSDDWEVLSRRSGDGERLARTNCDTNLHSERLRFPFRIESGRVTLLALPGGKVGFEELGKLGPAADDPYVVLSARSWFGDVRRARDATRAALAAGQRTPRDGYDIYPACDGMTSVVRSTGTPVPWDRSLDVPTSERRFRPPILTGSLHATGFGRGCVRRYAYVLLISDPTALDAALDAAGAWLVKEDLAGEIGIVVTVLPEP